MSESIETGDVGTIGDTLARMGANAFFDLAGGIFSALGFDTAADNLRRYRSGAGGLRTYSSEEIDQHPAFAAAEQANRLHFENGTFIGLTGNSNARQTLLNLGDGETGNFADYWEQSINSLNSLDTVYSRPSTYFAFGRTGPRSRGAFQAARNGDEVTVTGTVTHGMYGPSEDNDFELFDFNPGQIGDAHARTLEGTGEAAPFAMRYSRSQDVSAVLRRSPDGALTLRSATWGPIR